MDVREPAFISTRLPFYCQALIAIPFIGFVLLKTRFIIKNFIWTTGLRLPPVISVIVRR